MSIMPRTLWFCAFASVMCLVGCGSSSSSLAEPDAVSGSEATADVDALAQLNAFRRSAGGISLTPAATHPALVLSATKHAGWQALDCVAYPTVDGRTGPRLNHGEPRANTFFVHNSLLDRITLANDEQPPVIFAESFSEDIASTWGVSAMNQLWNTVYHRLPMMQHRATRVGYGDLTMARRLAPGLPSDDPWGNPGTNGFATLDWAVFGTPNVTLSYWPATGAVAVPRIFYSDTEGPDPAHVDRGFSENRNAVGPVLHCILPIAVGLTGLSVNVHLDDGVPLTCWCIVGGNRTPVLVAPIGSEVVKDNTPGGLLNPGEIFVFPKSALPVQANATWSVSATTALGEVFRVGPLSFTTGG